MHAFRLYVYKRIARNCKNETHIIDQQNTTNTQNILQALGVEKSPGQRGLCMKCIYSDSCCET